MVRGSTETPAPTLWEATFKSVPQRRGETRRGKAAGGACGHVARCRAGRDGGSELPEHVAKTCAAHNLAAIFGSGGGARDPSFRFSVGPRVARRSRRARDPVDASARTGWRRHRSCTCGQVVRLFHLRARLAYGVLTHSRSGVLALRRMNGAGWAPIPVGCDGVQRGTPDGCDQDRFEP